VFRIYIPRATTVPPFTSSTEGMGAFDAQTQRPTSEHQR